MVAHTPLLSCVSLSASVLMLRMLLFGSINLLVWNCFPIIYEFMCVGVYVFVRIVHDVFC